MLRLLPLRSAGAVGAVGAARAVGAFASAWSAVRRSSSTANDTGWRLSEDGLLEVARVEHGLYRLFPSAKAVAAVGAVGFVDVCGPGSTLAVGRPFGMLEGPGSVQLTLESPLSGEVSDLNEVAMADPAAVGGWGERGEGSWLAEIDCFLEEGEGEGEWESLPRGSMGAEAAPAPPDGFVKAPGTELTYLKDMQQGEGKPIVAHSNVTVHATGVVKETGKQFWSTKDPGHSPGGAGSPLWRGPFSGTEQPFTYQVGVGSVIKGWDQGCLGMKEGGIRDIFIPAKEGYGAGGFPAWGIPPGGTLTFTIECLKVE